MVPERHFADREDRRRSEALLTVADVLVRHRTLADLFRGLSDSLHAVVSFDLASYSLHDPHKNTMQLQVWEGREPTLAPAEVSLDESPSGWVWRTQKSLVMSPEEMNGHFRVFRALLEKKGIRSYCALPLTTARRRLGSMGLGSIRPEAYGENELLFLQRVTDLVALAVENVLGADAFRHEKKRLETLLHHSAALISGKDVLALFPSISALIREVIPQELAFLTLWEEAQKGLRIYALDCPLAPGIVDDGQVMPLQQAIGGSAFLEGEAQIRQATELAGMESGFARGLVQEGIQSLCCVPLISAQRKWGTLSLGSRKRGTFTREDVRFLQLIANQIAAALDNAEAYRKVAELSESLKKEKLYLEDEIRTELHFEEIIGEAPSLKNALAQVNTVAPSDATVLILGETGTGKELIARAIHRMSSHKDASFIKLNCAAIPTGLLESELFGHEKGAFTGAISQKVGRLELADKGTLFLDEVGDIPLELQPKLLRVLQDQEFERLGGIRTMRVNVRIIAATNRDLAKSVAAQEFRRDLFYRLHVFPIRLPALRERANDIPLLVRYFVQKFSRRMNKRIETIPTEAMRALQSWSWPGNIRELENFIERSIILSQGTSLSVPLAELQPAQECAGQGSSLQDLERVHILRVLRESGGVIAGLNGAAARLGMKRTTLQSKMQKLGIARKDYHN
jgi:formate hydrogenlyase transcriptional activator